MVIESNLHRGKGIVRGDKFPIRRIVPGIPAGTTVSKAWLTLKAAIADADPGIFMKEITTSNVNGTGHVEDAGTDGAAILRFDLTEANTLAMTADQSYFYDIQLLLSSGDIVTIEAGFTSARAQVTQDNT